MGWKTLATGKSEAGKTTFAAIDTKETYSNATILWVPAVLPWGSV